MLAVAALAGAPAPEPRFLHRATVAADGRSVLPFGGSDTHRFFNDVWKLERERRAGDGGGGAAAARCAARGSSRARARRPRARAARGAALAPPPRSAASWTALGARVPSSAAAG